MKITWKRERRHFDETLRKHLEEFNCNFSQLYEGITSLKQHILLEIWTETLLKITRSEVEVKGDLTFGKRTLSSILPQETSLVANWICPCLFPLYQGM